MNRLRGVRGARLPRWLLPSNWPQQGGEPRLATLNFTPEGVDIFPDNPAHQALYQDLAGALVLPPLVEPHVHLDKTFTVQRSPAQRPGLLAAIEAMQKDRANWSAPDIAARARRALQWAVAAGVGLLRSHIDWYSPEAPPAWQVISQLTHPLCDIERVALVPLPLFARAEDAENIARQVAESGKGALLGGFIHSSNWQATAMNNLMAAATRWQLDIDLHIDEELSENAPGLRWLATYLQQQGFNGHITCSHGCALSLQPDAAEILDILSHHHVTLIALPLTNLLLQDAIVGRTPRQRGLTLIKEAQARGIPLLLGCDNVQDAFCPVGSYDPLDTLFCGIVSAQLTSSFDHASALICQRAALQPGSPVLTQDLLIFPQADTVSWPLRHPTRYRLVNGIVHSLTPGENCYGA
ncbi:cytosine deaminase [Erwinia endophytica]|uniref:amidohydrolase family protein n=1 Tax=Erwinia endophytica TaxID=1563158 RepID=UPI001265EEA9|nr:amidohydrolase family protein [Erwinia endophytica]KAB8312396.1 cytosine deaminase [Erwinia endophytica]